MLGAHTGGGRRRDHPSAAKSRNGLWRRLARKAPMPESMTIRRGFAGYLSFIPLLMMTMQYPINEMFQTPQGEGYFTGVPCHFHLRLQGCPVGCRLARYQTHRDKLQTWEVLAIQHPGQDQRERQVGRRAARIRCAGRLAVRAGPAPSRRDHRRRALHPRPDAADRPARKRTATAARSRSKR